VKFNGVSAVCQAYFSKKSNYVLCLKKET